MKGINMRHKLLIAIPALTAILTTSCQKETIHPYEGGESKVYFQTQASWTASGYVTYTTSTSYSFVEAPDYMKSVVLKGDVRLMGNVTDYDRKISVRVDEAHTTMKPGEGFEINTDTLRMKAGENAARVNVRLLRTKALMEKADTLTLQLLPNEAFGLLETYKASNDWSSTTTAALDGTRYTFIVGEVYSRPNSWNGGAPLYVNRYFGEWTRTRYLFINKFFGFSIDDWTYVNGATSKIAIGRMPYYARRLQKELQRLADAGTPAKEDDGSFMQLPSPYEVDYSDATPTNR